jgi:RHS repeat-associated protein
MKKGVIVLILLVLISPIYAKDVDILEIHEGRVKVDVVAEKEPSLSGTITYFYAGTKLLASKENDELIYHYQDRLGSDIESKSLPFGQEIVDGGRFSFTGKELDSNLYYFGARYYDPNLGRFTSVDPIPSELPYTYVNNNPMNFVDPSGMVDVRIQGLEDQDLSILHNFFGTVPDSLYPNPVSESGVDVHLTREEIGENIGGAYDGKSISINPLYLYDFLDAGGVVTSKTYDSAMVMLFLDIFHETVHWNIGSSTSSPPQAENFPKGVSPFDYEYMVKNYFSQGEYDNANAYIDEYRDFYFEIIDDRISEERVVRGVEINAINWLGTFDSGVGKNGRAKLVGRTEGDHDFEENFYLDLKYTLGEDLDVIQSFINNFKEIDK